MSVSCFASVETPKDDMHDAPDDLAHWPQLAGRLQVCAEVIEPAFRKADGAALRHQWNHRQLVKLATVFGTAAIIFAILQLAFGDAIGLHQIAFDELVAVGFALVAFVLGSLVAFQILWLVERNKAERLRMAEVSLPRRPKPEETGISNGSDPSALSERPDGLAPNSRRILQLPEDRNT
ncbi:MAG: hypothetical protein ACHRXM_21420 [Isosphaerales bacterium]